MQPCSYWKYDTLHAIVECGSAFFEEISKGNANFSELRHTLNTYGSNIDISFVLSSKGTLVYNSSSSVLVLNRTSRSLLHTFVVDTQLPFNIPVILSYTNTSRVSAFWCLLVLFILGRPLFGFLFIKTFFSIFF